MIPTYVDDGYSHITTGHICCVDIVCNFNIVSVALVLPKYTEAMIVHSAPVNFVVNKAIVPIINTVKVFDIALPK